MRACFALCCFGFEKVRPYMLLVLVFIVPVVFYPEK